MNDTDDQLDRMLQAADPLHRIDLGAASVRVVLDEIGTAIPARAPLLTALRRQIRGHRKALTAGFAVVAVFAATAAPATANWFGLHTERFGSTDSTEIDTSEFLDGASPEM